MNTKFDKVIYSFIKENNISVDPKRLATDLERVAKTIPMQSKKALETTSQALAGATETDPIEAEFLKLTKYKDISDEEKTKILMGLIANKAIPDITGKMEKDNQNEENSEEDTEENQTQTAEKPKQSSFTYSAPTFQ